MRAASLRQFKAFVAVARHRSFVRAAEELHLTPPAISLQIGKLEREVGFPLFDRRGKAVSLTMPGEYLLVYARRMLSTLKEAEDAMARLRGAQSGRITIGMVSTAKYFLPRLLARFREEHRGVELRMELGNREQLVRMLRDAEVDLAVMGRPPREIEARAEVFAEQPHAIVAAPVHRLAQVTEITPAMLSGEEFIVREPGSGTRAAMEGFFRDARIAPPRVMESTSNETIKQAVIANMGLAFLSLHTVGLELDNGLLTVLDVAGLPLTRRWHIVHLQSKPLSPAAEALRYFVLEHGEALIRSQFGSGAQRIAQDTPTVPPPSAAAARAEAARTPHTAEAAQAAQAPLSAVSVRTAQADTAQTAAPPPRRARTRKTAAQAAPRATASRPRAAKAPGKPPPARSRRPPARSAKRAR